MVPKYFTQKESRRKKMFNSLIRVLAGGDPSQTREVKPRELELMLKREGQTTRNQGLDLRV